MIERFRIPHGKNDYAIILNPSEHEDERKQLISEGYLPCSRYQIRAKDSEDYGKTAELWVK